MSKHRNRCNRIVAKLKKAEEVKNTHHIEMMIENQLDNLNIYSAIILAVAHVN
jgi:hypothetical protein